MFYDLQGHQCSQQWRGQTSGMWTKFHQCIVMDVKRWKAVQNPAFATLSSRWLCPCHSFYQNESWSRQGEYHYPELSSWTRTKKMGFFQRHIVGQFIAPACREEVKKKGHRPVLIMWDREHNPQNICIMTRERLELPTVRQFLLGQKLPSYL